jgi:hypothetical protein
MPRSKVSAFFSVLLVFVSGAAMGAVGYRLYAVKSVASVTNPSNLPKKSQSPDEFRKLIVNSLKDAVKLDSQQFDEVQKIYIDQHEAFDQVHNKYQAQLDEIHQGAKRDTDQIHDASVAKIKALLRPDQEPLYEKWQADRAADRKRHQQQQQHDHPEGKGRPSMPRPLP